MVTGDILEISNSKKSSSNKQINKGSENSSDMASKSIYGHGKGPDGIRLWRNNFESMSNFNVGIACRAFTNIDNLFCEDQDGKAKRRHEKIAKKIKSGQERWNKVIQEIFEQSNAAYLDLVETQLFNVDS